MWWASYAVRGQRIRTSTGIQGNAKGLGRREANDWLKQRQAEAALGIVTPRADKLMVAELVDQLFKHYRDHGHKSDDTHRWTKHLAPFLGKCKAADITPVLLRQYIAQRKGEKGLRGDVPQNATINRELALLRAAFNLARKEERLRHVPYFPMLPEDNVREGFLRDEDYGRLAEEAAKVGLWLRTLVALYYNFGWRKSEAAEHLKVGQIDLTSRTILLSRYSTKNGKPKRLKMTEEVFELVAASIAGKGPEDAAITREDGSPVGDFRKAWRSICVAAGLPNLLVHDLRRSAVRNLRRLGFAEKTIMEISGHQTESVFRRYDITDEADLAEVAAALDRKREADLSRQADLSQLSHNPPATIQ